MRLIRTRRQGPAVAPLGVDRFGSGVARSRNAESAVAASYAFVCFMRVEAALLEQERSRGRVLAGCCGASGASPTAGHPSLVRLSSDSVPRGTPQRTLKAIGFWPALLGTVASEDPVAVASVMERF